MQESEIEKLPDLEEGQNPEEEQTAIAGETEPESPQQ